MVREKEIFLIRLMKATDAFIIMVSFAAAYFITLGLKQIFDLGPLAFATSSILNIIFEHFRHLWAGRSLITILPFINEKSECIFFALIPQSTQ